MNQGRCEFQGTGLSCLALFLWTWGAHCPHVRPLYALEIFPGSSNGKPTMCHFRREQNTVSGHS